MMNISKSTDVVREKTATIVIAILAGLVLLIACSGGKKLEGSYYYKVSKLNNSYRINPDGLEFITEDTVVWTSQDSFTFSYEIEDDRIILTHPSYSTTGEMIDNYDFPDDAYIYIFKNGEEVELDIKENNEAITIENDTYIKMEPSVFE